MPFVLPFNGPLSPLAGLSVKFTPTRTPAAGVDNIDFAPVISNTSGRDIKAHIVTTATIGTAKPITGEFKDFTIKAGDVPFPFSGQAVTGTPASLTISIRSPGRIPFFERRAEGSTKV